MLLPSLFLFIFEFTSIILYCECAPSNKLGEIKNDISKLGTTIEDFAFHIVQDIVADVAPIEDTDESENDATGTGNTTETAIPDSTTVGRREKRAAMSETECLQRCKSKNNVAEEHIEDLKSEVRKLQELVEIMNEQQDIAKSIDSSEKSTFKEPNEELLKIKHDLRHAVKSLNDTKLILNAQRKKSDMLERELMSQKMELEKLRFAFINRSDDLVGANIVGASPDFPELSKLLKTIGDDENDAPSDSDEIQSRIRDLELQLQRKKRRQNLSKKLRALEDKLKVSEKEDDGLLIRLEKLIKNEEAQIKNEGAQGRDGDINNLDDLKSAIEKLRPKEESRQQSEQRQQTNFPQKQLSPFPQGSNSFPYLCLVENNGPNNFNFRKFYGPATGGSNVKVFTPETSEPSYGGPQANSYSTNQEKPSGYQSQAGPQVYQPDSSLTYKEDLRKQIDALQNAINNLNRPEYIRKPEDKAVISNLEYQVSDLRNILNNQGIQGYGSYPEQQYRSSRIKRDVDEDEEMIDKMTEFLGKILHEDVRSHPDQNELNDLQERIDEIKKQLDSTDSNLRSTGGDLTNLHQSYLPQPKNHLLKKQDFFSDFLGKIIDKIIASIPVVVSKLFNFSFEELSGYGYENDGYEMQNIFKNLGVFGYLPVILLRLISGFGSIVKVLKKSEFFRKFLLPVLVLLTVSGAVLFLIWWLQPDDDLNNNNYIAYDSSYSNYTSPRPVSVNYPVYNRSYYNK